MCKFMIDNDVQLDARNNDGETVLHLAAEAGHLDIFKMIYEMVDEKSPTTEYGYTPIHKAAKSGHMEICKFIIENNGDPNKTNHDGEGQFIWLLNLVIWKFSNSFWTKLENMQIISVTLHCITLLNPDTWKCVNLFLKIWKTKIETVLMGKLHLN